MTSYEAIFYRQSVRKFRMEYISKEFFRNMRKFEQGLIPYDPSVPYCIEMYNAMDKEVHARGMFLIKAPYYLVIYSRPHANAQTNAGYLLEQIVLYMTEKGVGSCYQGRARIPDAPVPEGMEPQMVLAFGLPAGKLHRDKEKARRRSLKELCVFKESPTEETRMMMQAARMAPSSFNSQPWRFVVYQNRIHVFKRKSFTMLPDTPFSRLNAGHFSEKSSHEDLSAFDIGIMLCHISLAAEEYWRDVEFKVTDQIAAKELRNNDYFISVMLV